MPHADFWSVSLREADLITRARKKAKNAEFDAYRVLNQELAHLITYAFHDPKKMPDFTKAAQQKAKPAASPEQSVEQLRSAFVSLHFQSKKGR